MEKDRFDLWVDSLDEGKVTDLMVCLELGDRGLVDRDGLAERVVGCLKPHIVAEGTVQRLMADHIARGELFGNVVTDCRIGWRSFASTDGVIEAEGWYNVWMLVHHGLVGRVGEVAGKSGAIFGIDIDVGKVGLDEVVSELLGVVDGSRRENALVGEVVSLLESYFEELEGLDAVFSEGALQYMELWEMLRDPRLIQRRRLEESVYVRASRKLEVYRSYRTLAEQCVEDPALCRRFLGMGSDDLVKVGFGVRKGALEEAYLRSLGYSSEVATSLLALVSDIEDGLLDGPEVVLDVVLYLLFQRVEDRALCRVVIGEDANRKLVDILEDKKLEGIRGRVREQMLDLAESFYSQYVGYRVICDVRGVHCDEYVS